MRKLISIIFAVAAAVSSVSGAVAEVPAGARAVSNGEDDRWYVGAGAGMLLPSTRLGLKSAATAVVRGGWNWTDVFALEAEGFAAPNVGASKSRYGRGGALWGAAFQGVWHPFNYERLEPFVTFGAGAMRDASNSRRFGSVGHDWVFGPRFGAGFWYFILENLSVRFDAGAMMAVDSPSVFAWGWNAGIVYSFGGSKSRCVAGDSASAAIANVPVDSDGDGLPDGEEMRLGTDPHRADSDSDGLSDYDEIKIHKTNPLAKDTDLDGLLDGEEVFKYKTDPNRCDTDGGGAGDGHEILDDRTNPLNPDDDPAVFVVAAGEAEETLGAECLRELDSVAKRILEIPGAVVVVEAHTDRNLASNSRKCVELCIKRAEAAKAHLVLRGVNAQAIETKGMGFSRPREKIVLSKGNPFNRRIEIYVRAPQKGDRN